MVDRWHYYNYSTPCYFKIDMGSCPTGAIPDMDGAFDGHANVRVPRSHSCR